MGKATIQKEGDVELSNSERIGEIVSDYLERKHQQLKNDYRDPSGIHIEHCGLIGLDIAKLLLEKGYQPRIMEVKELVDNNFITLVPKPFEGRVKWAAHQVCCCEGLAFDPVIGKPVEIEKYTEEMFGKDIPMEERIPFERIEEFINRFKTP